MPSTGAGLIVVLAPVCLAILVLLLIELADRCYAACAKRPVPRSAHRTPALAAAGGHLGRSRFGGQGRAVAEADD